MMYQIRPAEVTDLDQVLTLLERLQSTPEHHIGYHGETRAELTEELAATHWPAATLLAVDDADRVHGVLTAQIDTTLGRVWWHGPFVDVPADHPAADRIWDRTADALYDRGRELPDLRDIADSELFGDVAHRRLAQFAQRHGYGDGTYTSVVALDGVDLVRMIGSVPDTVDGGSSSGGVEIEEFPAPPTDSVAAAALIRLHDECFPDTYLSAAQLLSGEGDRVVVVAKAGGRVVGYAAGRMQQLEYYLDFVAVATDFRGRGIGGPLITLLVQRLADRHGERPKVIATVFGTNTSSQRMLGKLGFHTFLEMVGYRLREQRLVA
jgi:ribosomal protein S18 acetylase RimI-like enzyme